MTVNVYCKLLCARLQNAYTSLASPYKYSWLTPQGDNSGSVLKVVTYTVQLLVCVVIGHGQFYPGPKPHQQILFPGSISWAECSFPVALWIPVKNDYNHVYMFVYVWFVFWFTGVLMCSDFKSVLGTCYGSWSTVIVFDSRGFYVLDSQLYLSVLIQDCTQYIFWFVSYSSYVLLHEL